MAKAEKPSAASRGASEQKRGGKTSPAMQGAEAASWSPEDLRAMREVFWHNVVREILGGLAMVAQKRPELMDGRFAVLTHGGERIPIGRVEPMFAMSIRDGAGDQQASAAVQMTVFRVATPEGEVFTLPVQEIRGVHELTPELLSRLQQEENEQSDSSEDGERRPFGFAAFRALPKRIEPVRAAPTHPME